MYEFRATDSLRFCNFEVRNNRLINDYQNTREVNHINVIPSAVKVYYQIIILKID